MLARMDRADICARFLDHLEFDPYSFQEEALLAWFALELAVGISAAL